MITICAWCGDIVDEKCCEKFTSFGICLSCLDDLLTSSVEDIIISRDISKKIVIGVNEFITSGKQLPGEFSSDYDRWTICETVGCIYSTNRDNIWCQNCKLKKMIDLTYATDACFQHIPISIKKNYGDHSSIVYLIVSSEINNNYISLLVEDFRLIIVEKDKTLVRN